MNKENILKLAEYMDRLPGDAYDQRYIDWTSGPRCGTPSCIAGHATYIAGQWSPAGPILAKAREWLGLDEKQSNALFTGFPRGVVGEYLTPRDAAATLRLLAETGDVRWHKVDAAVKTFDAFLREIFTEESEA